MPYFCAALAIISPIGVRPRVLRSTEEDSRSRLPSGIAVAVVSAPSERWAGQEKDDQTAGEGMAIGIAWLMTPERTSLMDTGSLSAMAVAATPKWPVKYPRLADTLSIRPPQQACQPPAACRACQNSQIWSVRGE